MSSSLKVPSDADALRSIAEQFGTPTYVYAEAIVRRQCRRLREALEGLPAHLLYAMKANACPAVLEVIRDEGLGLDVVSPGELALAEGLGFASDRVLYTANNMTDAEMHTAQATGVLLNIGERSRLKRFGQAYPGAEVCVRVDPQVGAGHHEHVVTAGGKSKFGIPIGEMEAVRALARAHDLRVVGLHQHIGSGILDADKLAEAGHVLIEAARPFEDLRFLNFGGGLGIPYRPGEAPLDARHFRRALDAPLQALLRDDPDVAFWFEPGRYLAAEAGVLLVRVNTVKRTPRRTFAGTDSGMAHLLRPAIYGAYHGLYNLSNPEAPVQSYDVVGNICESGDVFARDRAVQEIREGDVLAIQDAGAYGMAMASTYNLRPLPAEVLLPAEGPPRLVRHRRTPEELAERLLRETREAGVWEVPR